MRSFFVIIFLFLTIFSYGQADIILYNGKIFTSDKSALWVEAIAVKGERIIATGNEKEILKLKGPQTKIIDLENHLVVPGFNDAHAHIGGNIPSRHINLASNPTDPTPWKTVRDSLAKIVKEIPAGTLIQSSINADLFEDRTARRGSLDSIAPQHPVILSAWSGHGKILNSSALTWLGLNEQSFFAGGKLEKDNNGKLTGYIDEYAGYRLGSALNAKLSLTKIIEDITSFHKHTASLGITTMQNMCTQLSAAIAKQVYSQQRFDCRTRLIAFPVTDKEGLLYKEWDSFFMPVNSRTYGSGIKIILDGTPIERLASMRESYNDRKGQYGRLNFTPEALKNFMQYALSHKQQIMIHAVGDSAAVTVFRVMRSLHPDAFWKDKRVRIEHGDMVIINKEDLQVIKKLGIVIVQNPAHLAQPAMTLQRYDSSQVRYYQSMRSLLDNDISFAIGSDGPVNPFLNLMLATFHPDNPKEAITLQEAVIAYTLGSAYAEFTEKEKGSLIKGKLADLAVLSQNIFEIAPDRLPSTESILTILGGEIVMDKKALK